ncbi:Neurotrophin 1 Source FlyBase [Halocaridina rubra]|uniref:Neurotrophin 1 Source FlyBase n=1 Tax=Halocaridina rubra TaxID=373956 RepID=A0AAN8XLF1_HALRR
MASTVTANPFSTVTNPFISSELSHNATVPHLTEVRTISEVTEVSNAIPLTESINKALRHIEPYFLDEKFKTRFTRMNNNSYPFLVVLLNSLSQGQTVKYHATPARAYSISFSDSEEYEPLPLSPTPFTTPKYASTPNYPTTPKYPEFYSSTSAFKPRFNPSVPPFHRSTPPPVYRGQALSFCDAHHPPDCAGNVSTYCLHDPRYPTLDVEVALKEDLRIAEKYADVSEQSADDLVMQISSSQEVHFDYSYYNPSKYDVTHWIGPEGYLCPSEIYYATPKRARNAKGEWRVIVNGVRYYTQTTRLEICMYPLTPCRMLAPSFKSKCVQKYAYHRLLSYDPCNPYKGLFVDIFRLPSACSCFVPAVKD